MELDLQDLTSVRLFANTARKIFPQIHILINNAGICLDTKRLAYTKDGFEMHMGKLTVIFPCLQFNHLTGIDKL